jgi:hypothetical protein
MDDSSAPSETAAQPVESHPADAWFRTHFDGKLLADLRWLGNKYQIMVFRLPERVAVADLCCTEEPRLARARADRLVQEHHPHDCHRELCAPWIQYSQA